MNHGFIYSTETGRGIGRDGNSGKTWGDGVTDLNSPYTIATLPPGMSEAEFMDKVEAYPGWNTGQWAPWINDCQTEVEKAFEYAGVPFPGVPNERIDIDDQLGQTWNYIKRSITDYRLLLRIR